MNWQPGKTLDGAEYFALMHGALEVGRYWRRSDGFVPASPRNNARPRTELEARERVLAAAARQLAGLLPTANVPRRTVEQNKPQNA